MRERDRWNLARRSRRAQGTRALGVAVCACGMTIRNDTDNKEIRSIGGGIPGSDRCCGMAK